MATRKSGQVSRVDNTTRPVLVPPDGGRDLSQADFPVELKPFYVKALEGTVYIRAAAGPVIDFLGVSPDGRDMRAFAALVAQLIVDKNGTPIFADATSFANTNLGAYMELSKAVGAVVNDMLGGVSTDPNA